MSNIIEFMRSFFAARFEGNEDRGATAVEYGLMVGLIAVAIIVAVTAVGGDLTNLFNQVVTALPGGTP